MKFTELPKKASHFVVYETVSDNRRDMTPPAINRQPDDHNDDLCQNDQT